ncbi:MAG: helix-turn-helix domain-containing protein, partial [Clostridia bacterium]
KKQAMNHAALFTALSGIGTLWIDSGSIQSGFNKQKPCAFCRDCKSALLAQINCRALITDAAMHTGTAGIGQIFFCRTGLCHILVPIYEKDALIGTVMSVPILCGDSGEHVLSFMQRRLSDADSSESLPPFQTNALLTMQPGKVEKAVRLLALAAAYPKTLAESELEVCREKLIKAITDGKPDIAQTIVDSALEQILMRNGDNFRRNKSDCIRFIFMLYEIMTDHGMLGAQDGWTEKQTAALADACSIGDLKSCTDDAAKSFMRAVFQSVSLKHTLLIQKATEIIKNGYRQKLTQNTVAGAVFLSPSYFSKIFKDNTGYSFNQYLNQIRITKAKELLANPVIDIELIPGMVGYDDRSYFGKVFRQLTGTTPKRYRDSVLH